KVSNYPNPFNPSTTISLSLSKDSPVSVKIYNVKGQCVKTLLDGNAKAGIQNLVWNGTDNQGKAVTSGIYLVKLSGNGFSNSHKMTLLK
ncbi:MAG TPA: FlgD immunoglobulin-like domain containing protein, partial [Candidatus Syntrophosphaera sp.]|nr:FlgD immunoglobulin-like domain containing protein [Candidatus Syntrophosphaera sp.]